MQRRQRWGTSAAAIALVVLSSCGGTGDGAVGSVSAMRTVDSALVTAPAAAPTTIAVAATAAAADIDPVALISAGLDALAAGYHFTTTVTLDGADVLVADGDHVGDGTRISVTRSDGAAVDYVVTPAGSWVRPTGGEWDVVASDTPPTTDPLVALRTPTTASVTSIEGTVTTIVATVPALALGVAADGEAQVLITLDGTALRDISYSTQLDGRAAVVRSLVGPVADATAVVAPV